MTPIIAKDAGVSGVRIVVACLALASSAIGGAALMADHKNAEISDLKATQSAATARAAQAALSRLVSERQRGDRLVTQLAALETDLKTANEEKDHAIRRLTVGRPCLGGAAVRVLNGTSQRTAAAMSTPAGQPTDADGGFATDTDIGLWIGRAQRAYRTCQGRLKAIADFYPEEAAEYPNSKGGHQ